MAKITGNPGQVAGKAGMGCVSAAEMLSGLCPVWINLGQPWSTSAEVGWVILRRGAAFSSGEGEAFLLFESVRFNHSRTSPRSGAASESIPNLRSVEKGSEGSEVTTSAGRCRRSGGKR